MNTQTPPKKRPVEQVAQHVYTKVPARASARAATTEEPSALPHRTGHSSGTHPEDTSHTTKSKLSQHQRSIPHTNAHQDEEEYDDVYPPRLPPSTRRYKQTIPQEKAYTVAKQSNRRGVGLYTLVVGSSIIVGGIIASIVPPLWQWGSDQFHYGYPRTYQTDANVGHGSAKYPDTHFIALNNHGYVEVIEIPQGEPSKDHPPQMYLIARPDTAAADQAPATLEFEDVNGDKKIDMIVHCNGNMNILYNDGHTFKEKP